MKNYSLVTTLILKSGIERKYTSFTPESLTKEDAEQASEQLKEYITSMYKDSLTGALTLKTSSKKEVLINIKEIALVEFDIIEV